MLCFQKREETLALALRRLFLGVALASVVGTAGHAQTPAAPTPQNNPAQASTPRATPQIVKDFIPVTDQILRAPKPEDWLLLRGNYQGWRYKRT
jgi:hypothetical protein